MSDMPPSIVRFNNRRFFRLNRLFLLAVLLVVLAACRNDGPTVPDGEPQSEARLTVEGSGLFSIDARALGSMGWRVDDPLKLSVGGEPLPVQRRENALYFYLPPDDPATRYSKQTTVWLTYGAEAQGLMGASHEGEISELMAYRLLEGQEEYKSIFEGDPWFWKRILASLTLEEQIETPGRQAGEVEITLRVAGLINVDHRLIVKLDGAQVGIFDWTGQERYEAIITSEQPAGETLSLTVEIPSDTEVHDQILVDEIVVGYPTPPVAIDGKFEGRSSADGVVRIEGISDPLAWQIGEEMRALPTAEGAVSLSAGERFVVLAPGQAQSAGALTPPAAAIPSEGAQYVAVVSPSLKAEVEPLLAYHEEQGRSTMMVEPQQVYDQYSNGLVDPLAFREMLKDGQLNWDTVPRWILLVGDSTYDPYGYHAEVPEAYIPSPFVMTIFGGETVSDNIIADLDEDGYPDVALGRLPARTPEQLKTYVEKRIAYSTETDPGEWTNRVVLAADGSEELFRTTSETIRESFPESIQSTTLYPEAGSDAESLVWPELEQGSLIVNYIGHGSVEQWGKDRLLTAQNAAVLTNGKRLPFYINMTCLAGLFSHPEQESLGESLLWAKEGGAIATLAPTSLTLPTGQARLNSELINNLLAPDAPTVGEVLDRAKRTVNFATENDRDVVATFNLLGDPALVLLRSTMEAGG